MPDERRGRRARLLWTALLAAVVIVPRCYLWGAAPAGVHGDEGGFAALGMEMFAAPEPLWTFGPQSLPNAHFWLYGAAIHVFGTNIWSARAVVAIFGLLQALAIVDVARRTAGLAAALTAALVMAMPLQLHFDRLAMCNVMTTATWAMALWCVVRFPRHRRAAVAAGAVVALGWYGYQGAIIAPLVVGAGVVPLLWQESTRRPTLRQLGLGAAGFALVIAPLAYGFAVDPRALFGRPHETAWLFKPGTGWTDLVAHLSATGWALLGRRFDQSGGFFPLGIPLVPTGLIALTAVGLVACRPPALRWALLTWIGLVLAGNVVREFYFVYSPVLICMVPALALATAHSARWLRWLAPIAVLLMIVPALQSYFATARNIPPSEVLPMAQAAAIEAADAEAVFVAGGLGCEHGLTAWALHGRPCWTPATTPLSAATPAQLFIIYPVAQDLDRILATRPDLVRSVQHWGPQTVHVWSPLSRQ